MTTPMNRSMATVLHEIEPQVHLDLDAGTVRIGSVDAQHDEQRELLRELGGLLYEHHHVGHHVTDGLDVSASRDTAYENTLAERLSHRTNRFRVPLHQIDAKQAVVEHMGLRTRVPRSHVHAVRDESADLDVPMLSPALSPGFALARGPKEPTDGGPMLRLYLGSGTRDDATTVFLGVLDVLHGRHRWQAKVASQARLYPRSDAVTVYLHPDELDALTSLVSVARRPLAAVAPRSAFTLPIADGVGCAWEPEAGGRPGSVSFGQHRARALAQLLIARADGTWRDGDTEAACRDRGIDPQNIWRNVTSPDLKLLRRPAQAVPADLAGASL